MSFFPRIHGLMGGRDAPIVYSDWFLPSKNELRQMYLNLHLFGVGGFVPNGQYWSSSEENQTRAWVQDFGTGSEESLIKYSTEEIRACRVFVSLDISYSLRGLGQSGGLIFYVDGNTYYECAPSDCDTSYFDATLSLLSTTSVIIGSGQDNTTNIVAALLDVGCAASICDEYTVTA